MHPLHRRPYLTVFALVLGVLGLVGPRAFGQQNLDAFLAQIQSDNADARRQASESAADYGAPAVVPLGRLYGGENRPVGRAARLALENIVNHASLPGAEQERAAVVGELAKLLLPAEKYDTRRLALVLLAQAGTDQQVPAIAEVMGQDDARLREMARWALERINTQAANQALLSALAQAQGQFACDLMATLGHNRFTPAVPALLQAAQSNQEPARIAALEALGRLGDARAADALRRAAAQGSPAERVAACHSCLLLASADEERGDQAAALGIYEECLRLATNTSQRIAALTGINRLGDAKSLPVVLNGLGDPDRVFQGVAIAFIDRYAGERAVQVMTDALKAAQPEARAGLLLGLAARGDPKVAPTLMAGLQDPSPVVKAAAATGLGQLGVQEAAGQLLALAETGPQAAKPPALNSYLKLLAAQLQQGKPPELLKAYNHALEIATGDVERNMALDGAAAFGDPSSLPLVEPLTQKEETRPAALAAYVAIGRSLVTRNQQQQAEQILRTAIARGPSRDVLAQAAAGLRDLGIDVDLAHDAGFVTNWWLAGPFPNANKAAWDAQYPPEQGVDLAADMRFGTGTFGWQPYHTTDIEGIVNFLPLFNPNQQVAAYAYAEVTVPAAQDATLRIGSDDGVKCWLNGRLAHANNADRPMRVDEDRADARLQAGRNTILLKILQGGGDWGFCLRLTDRQGRPVGFQQRAVQ